MPIATVQTPDGKTMRLEVPEGATEDEIVAFAMENYKPTETSDPYLLNLAREGLQGLTLNTADELGALAAAGMAKLTHGADFTDTYKDMHSLMEKERDAFRDENPKAALAAEVGGGLLTGGAGIGKATAAMAAKGVAPRLAANAGTGALMGGIAGAASDSGDDRVASGLTGAAIGGAGGVVLGEVVNAFSKGSALRKEVANLIKSGSTDKKTARYVLDGAQRVRKDPAAIKAIDQGVDEGVVAAVKGASTADRANMRKMVAITRAGKENARTGATERATDVIGDSLSKRIKIVYGAKQSAGEALEGEARKLRGKPFNFREATRQFMDDIDSLGVRLTNKDGRIVPEFDGSDIEGVSGAENAIKKVIARLQSGDQSAYDAHRIKRLIDEHLPYGKSQEGLSGRTLGILGDLRKKLNAALAEQYDGYRAVNKRYSEAKGALDAIQDAAGSKIDIRGDNADKALGTLSRSVLSNIRSRAGLLNAIDDLDKVANQYGKFDDDIITQAVFADELDRLFGTAAKTSLQGEGEKFVRAGLTGNMKEWAIEQAAKKADDLRGISEDNAFEALVGLLRD